MNYDLLIKKAKEQGINDIEIYAQHDQGLSIDLFEGDIDKYNMSDVTGLAIRGLYNGQMGYVSVENASDDNIDFIVQKIIDNASTITTKEENFIFEGSDTYPELDKKIFDFTSVDPQKKITLLKQLEDKIRSIDSRIVKIANCSYQESKVETTIQNSKGLNLSKVDSYAFIYAQAVAKENEDVKSNFDYVITSDFNTIDVDELAERIVKRAVSQLNAKSVKSNQYPIIFENKVMTSLLKAFEPMFSGESALKNLTKLKDKVGEKIASEKITLVDDPLTTKSFFTNSFDDEGVACKRKEIISSGVLTTLLHNLKTAKKFNTESTGNGFKAGVSAPISVSSNNMYITPGTTSYDDIISSTDEGILITSVAGLHAGVDPVSGDFSLQSSGYLIENGKISRPVTLIVVAGNFLEMLNNVETIGSDLEFSYNQIGSPSIKINKLAVSGE